MAVEKFHEKNIAMFSKLESTSGTYIASVAADATPATTLDGSITYDTTAYAFIGDAQSRDEFTVIKDSYGEVNIETMQQVIGTVASAPSNTTAPMHDLLRACGANITVISTVAPYSATVPLVIYDNSQTCNDSVSVDYRKTSYDNTKAQKIIRLSGCRGMVDVNIALGEIPKLKFNFKGNSYPPVEGGIIAPDYGTQTSTLANIVRKSTIVTAQIASLTDAIVTPSVATAIPTAAAATGNIVSLTFVTGATTGALVHGSAGDIRAISISGITTTAGNANGTFIAEIVSDTIMRYVAPGISITGLTGTPTFKVGTAPNTICLSSLAASNFFGFDYQRYLTGCDEGFAKGATPTDVSLTVLEDKGTLYNTAISIAAVTAAATSAVITVPWGSFTTSDTISVSGVVGTGTAANITNTATLNVVNAAITNVADNDTATCAVTYTIPAMPTGGTTAITSTTGVILVEIYNSIIFDAAARLSDYFGMKIKFGTGANKYVSYKWDKLQLTNAKEGKVASYFGTDITFRNTGRSFIELS